MSDELKTVRIALAMTPSELADIDDWSFDVRIRSRSEAIRQLIQAGLDAKRAAKKQAKKPGK